MRVYTYFEEAGVSRDSGWLLERWAANWRATGFEPVILGESDARKHPACADYMNVFRSLPTTNPAHYELCCYARHLAMAVLGGFMTDYDVFNLTLEPFEITELCFLEYNRVPCAVAGRPEDFGTILQWIKDYRLAPDDQFNNRPHASDMIICRRHTEVKALDLVKEFGEEREGARMIHFANDCCRSAGGKRKAIESFFP